MKAFNPKCMKEIVKTAKFAGAKHITLTTRHPELDSVTFERGRIAPLDREGMDKYLAAEMCNSVNMHLYVISIKK